MRDQLISAILLGGAIAAVNDISAEQRDAIVPLECYVVEAASAPAYLQIGFRHHMIWSGIHTLTFKAVPAGWAKAGIKVCDQLIEIDGKVVDGMTMRELVAYLTTKFAPLRNKTADSVPFIFRINSSGARSLQTVEVVLKTNNAFTIGT